ncbi:hypothetical protein ACJKIH_03165 [Brucella pseudogrignonensis]|uniref:hypothetical protein n=1 Tax=Brucella pseudogrignonensis TaxID=419475 RepID=UPI0038B5B314
MGPKWQAYQNAHKKRVEAERWLKHIGAKGRYYDGKTETLSLSQAHASFKMTVAGQYDAGGNNYRESPSSFNSKMLAVIHDKFEELRDEVMRRLAEDETTALKDAKSEVQAVLADIEKAESEAA